MFLIRPTASIWVLMAEAVLASTVIASAELVSEKSPAAGIASWYGEEHRGKLMANGRRFDPDKFTAASWFYPLGTKVRVTMTGCSGAAPASVVVTITDRVPAKHLVRDGRIIDLSHAPFKRLANPGIGLVSVSVEPVESGNKPKSLVNAEVARATPPALASASAQAALPAGSLGAAIAQFQALTNAAVLAAGLPFR